MNQPPPPTQPAHPTQPEQRISTVIGDRLCIRCAFNLSGQPVVRENVYGMAIVRCPECSTIASLQEYPLLGKWAGRFAAMLAAVWLLVLIGGIFATAGILFGMSQGTVEMGSWRLATHISVKHKEWFDAAAEADKAAVSRTYGGQPMPTGPHVWVDGTWWSKQDPKTLLADLGGPFRAIDRNMLEPLFWGCLIALILGTAWSVFLLHMRRRRLLIFSILPVALAALFAYMALSTQSRTWAWGMAGSVYTIQEAKRILWPWVLSVTLASMFAFLIIGGLIGRSLVRGLVRLLLPPRMMGSMAFLWIVEGRQPPRPRRPVAASAGKTTPRQ